MCSLETQGVFINLVSVMWRKSGSITSDAKTLATRLRISQGVIESALAELCCYGIVEIDDENMMRIEFVSEQLTELQELHTARSLAGSKGGKAKKLRKGSNAKPKPDQLETELETELEPEPEPKQSVFELEFEQVWKEYPEKAGKTNARKAYCAARKSGVAMKTVEEGIDRYRNYVTQKRRTKADFPYKHGSTWFYQRCWDDEFTVATANRRIVTAGTGPDLAK